MTGRTTGAAGPSKAARTAVVAVAMAAPARYRFNPGPEFSDRVRREGAGIVNSGRFSAVAGSGGNAVMVWPPAGDEGGSGSGAYSATACPAKCQCREFRERAACPHVLAAMIVRAGRGCGIAAAAPSGKTKKKQRRRRKQPQAQLRGRGCGA